MKKFLPILTSILIIITAIISCDKINKPYKVERTVVQCDTPSFPALDKNNVIQKYLLEDYTGHKCQNCPRAQRIAVKMKSQMGDTLIIMAIHAGTQSQPEADNGDCSYSTDYRTEAGNKYTEKFNISIFPYGMINRMFFGGKQSFGSSDWESNLNSISRTAPIAGLQIITEENNGEFCVFVKTTLLSDITQPIRLSVLLIESGMVSPQKDGIVDSCEYVHNHVLRTSLAPIEGDNLDISTENNSQIKGYSFKLSDAWKKENCHIIAFIHDANTNEILQVEEIKLTK